MKLQTTTGDDDFVARLAVGGSDEPRSGTFRVWSPKGKSDVYAGIRDIAGEIKISLHESGHCLAGLTHQFAAKEADAVTRLSGKRHQSTWTRPTHTGRSIVNPLQFSIPASELRQWENTSGDNKTTWIDPPKSTHSIIVSCIFSGQTLSDAEWPGRQNRTHLVGTKLLPNGEKFWLVWQDCPTSDLEHNMILEAKARMAATKMIPFSHRGESSSPPTRSLIFKKCPNKALLLVLDAAEVVAA